MKHKKIMLSVLLLSIGITAQAQQAITATGRDASGSGGSISYSAGQVVYTTNTDTSGRVSEGVQQPYEFFILGTKETESNISLLVFPNPTADNLTLKISDYNNEKLSYQLFDMQGKLLNKGPVRAQQTPIDTSNLLPATYFIYVVNQDNKYVQSFKIIKN